MNEAVMSKTVLEAKGVERSFRQGPIDLKVLQGVNLEVRAGERLAIIGASGSGKTTLLQILGGLDRPTSGHVRIAGSDIHALDEKARGELHSRRRPSRPSSARMLSRFSRVGPPPWSPTP